MGDVKSNQRERLIEENQGLVFYLVARVHRALPVRHDYEDLVGYGMLGLVEAAKAYNPSNETKFSTFAFYRIRGAIYDGISETCWMSRAQYRRHITLVAADQKRRESADKNGPPAGDGNESTESTAWDYAQSDIVALTAEDEEKLENSEDSVSQSVVKLETESLLCQAISQLPDRENQLITMVYFEGCSLQSAAERIGVSKSWASRMHQKIIEQLAFEMNRPSQEEKKSQPKLLRKVEENDGRDCRF